MKIKKVPVEYIESGTFCGGEEDCFRAKIKPGEDCVVIKKSDWKLVSAELKRLKEYDYLAKR